MRARLFVIARFVAYAAIIAVGVHMLVNRDDARGEPAEPPGEWVSGETTQGLPVHVKVHEHRVIAVDPTWRARCQYGATHTMTTGFVDAFEGDFERDGRRFADEWEQSNAGWGDQTAHLEARLSGVSANGVARGSVSFELEVEENGEPVQRCDSGSIGFAVDLPGA